MRRVVAAAAVVALGVVGCGDSRPKANANTRACALVSDAIAATSKPGQSQATLDARLAAAADAGQLATDVKLQDAAKELSGLLGDRTANAIDAFGALNRLNLACKPYR